jgi:flagellar hook-basal body complex protein FliE
MIDPNNNVNSVLSNVGVPTSKIEKGTTTQSNFTEVAKTAGKYISKVDDIQQTSDISITELLSGKNTDVTTIVSAVAKAEVSFKVLVGVRNKLIEAYKQTMNMPL